MGSRLDHGYGRTIGNAINRGNPWSSLDPIGYSDRQKWLVRAWAVWGEGELLEPAELYQGAWGPKVGSVQRRLKELGYAVGTIDAVLGLSLIHISEPTRQAEISYAVFC